MVGEMEPKTNIRYKNIEDFESYNNAIDVDCNSADVFSTRWLFKLNTRDFNKVNRSHYGRCTDLKQWIVEYTGITFYIPTSLIFLNVLIL